MEHLSKLDQYRVTFILILYPVSLILPGLHLIDGDIVEGWRLLLTAWYGVLILEIPWFANPLFFFGLLCALKNRPVRAGIFGSLAFLVGLLSLRSKIWIAGHTHITELGVGFYVWMATFLLLASFFFPTLPRRRSDTERTDPSSTWGPDVSGRDGQP